MILARRLAAVLHLLLAGFAVGTLSGPAAGFDCLPAHSSEPAVAASAGPLAGARGWSLVRGAESWPEGLHVPPATLAAGPAVDALRLALASAGVRLAVAPGAWEGGPGPSLGAPVDVGGSVRSVVAAVSAASGGGLSASWAPGRPGHVLVGAPPLLQMTLPHADAAALAAAAVRSGGGEGISLLAGPWGGPSPALRFSASASARARIEEALGIVDGASSAALLDGAFAAPAPGHDPLAGTLPPDALAAGPGGLSAAAWDSPEGAPFPGRSGAVEPRRVAVPLGVPAVARPGECLAALGPFAGAPPMRVGFLGWDPRDPSRLRLSFSLDADAGGGSVELPVAPGGVVAVSLGRGLPSLGARVRWRASSGAGDP